jgi:ABC-2 type transport system permease protein
MDMQRELNNIFIIAAKEFKDYIKSKRFILVGVLYALMALAIIGIELLMFNSQGTAAGFKPSSVLSLMDILNIILVLLAVIITADTISVEKKDRTIYQLLSKPVERSTVVFGKFLGCLGVVSFFFASSSLLAYILVIVLTGAYPSVGDVLNVIEVILFMVLLFSVYVALGTLISTVTKNPLISILGGIIAWIALFFSNTIGGMIGYTSLSNGNMMVLGDPFTQYPIYAKALVLIDPISHDLAGFLLGSGLEPDGMPAWANVIFLLAYVGILLLVSVELFKRQDV